MSTSDVTLFSWGYEGWGNWTPKLIEAVDAVEKARGRSPPIFVDIRASRKVRAEGFKEHAFERLLGPDRYRWQKGLGNKAILTGADRGEFVDPSQVSDLLDLALDARTANRRVIFYCSCPIPVDGCHRQEVAPELFKEAKRRKQAVTIVEWPGFESEPKAAPELKVSRQVLNAVAKGARQSVPLSGELPAPTLLGLPWYTPFNLEAEGEWLAIFSGPAEHRAGGWQLPALGMALPVAEGLRFQRTWRKTFKLLPRCWPADAPSQEPKDWSGAVVG